MNNEENMKVDAEDIIKSFKVENVNAFSSYLKEVWMDLLQRGQDKCKGINKLTFASYYVLPGIISDRLFSVFNKSQTGFIDINEFISGMKCLFCGDFAKCSKFIFDLYNFKNTDKITKEDIRTVLSYVALSKEDKINNDTNYNYMDRVTSQEELHLLLENSFKKIKGDSISYTQFIDIIENVSSDIYFIILFFLLEKRPFTKTSIIEYEKQMEKKASKDKSPNVDNKKLISKIVASPTVLNKSDSGFSPSLVFIRESKKRRTVEVNQLDIDKNSLIPERNKNKRNTLSTKKGNISLFVKNQQNALSQSEKQAKINFDINCEDNNSCPVQRKTKTNLKDIEGTNSRKEARKNTYKYKDVNLMPAYKSTSFQPTKNDKGEEEITNASENIFIDEEGEEEDEIEEPMSNVNIGSETKDLKFQNSDDEIEEDEEVVKHEGYLYKMIDGKKLKKLWFKLLHKDLYFFKNEKEKVHKGMHNLSGVFLKEEIPETFANQKFYVFTIIYPKKERTYFVDNESQYKLWIATIKIATGYTNLTDIYEISQKLGNGKFGLVRLGINKHTGKKVAIKIMSKKEMDNQDLELVRTEIEILKICQHPNIITLYEIFENVDYFYIIMELCEGGDLFSYLEKRKFRLTEEKACFITYKMCTAIFYIHSYGIAHRDIKPENVLMTSMEDDADIRILDFGLSKIIGPEEYCSEPYGTLSYVAPEVLLEKPYNKSVDIWSLGVTAYLLLSASLPFDHPQNDREIARQTIHDKLPFKGMLWTEISQEAIDFITHMLDKDPVSRFTIKEALDHAWFKKFIPKTHLKANSIDQTHPSLFKHYSSSV